MPGRLEAFTRKLENGTPSVLSYDPLVERIERESGGYAIRSGGAIYIPIIDMPNPGTGEGKRFLDNLPTDETIKIPGVISAVLAGMLLRRGFVIEWEHFERAGEDVDVYVRRPA